MTVEGVLLEQNPDWFKYMLGVMKLEGWREYWLSVFFLPNFWHTFRVTASDRAVADNWSELSARRELRRSGKAAPVHRVKSSECETCPYLAEEPCASEVPRLGGG